MEKLSDLYGIGEVTESNLNAVGINTPDELRKIGSYDAFLKIRLQVDDGACLAMLTGIESAVQGVKKKNLPSSTKEELKAFYKAL